MIGCVLTGHGSFAPGIYGAVEMIIGPQDSFGVVDFKESESLEIFQERLQASVEDVLKKASGAIIFTDLLGGTPFRTAMLVAANFSNVEVIAGTNLPILIEGSLKRTLEEDAKAFADSIVESGRDGLNRFELNLSNDDDDIENEDGI